MNNIEIVEEITDGKVFLRKISEEDAKFLYKSLKKEVTKHLSINPLSSIEYSKKLIKRYEKYWDKKLQFNYVIELRQNNNKEKDVKKLGSISIWNLSWRHFRGEIGIWLNSRYWKQGYAKRALNLIKLIALHHLNLNRIEAHIAVKNKRSINLFIKCGFSQEGRLKSYLYLDGEFQDAVLLSLLRN
ncbi:MAG: GNAT family N-acetyltransferase [Candidatus Lokiarchaeota archaeon]|nr:GNAT family N-acetyltransferase [Candidatus Lokiarchaeota archaeon]